MFLKQFIAYRFSRELELNLTQLEQQLKEFMFVPCGSQDKQKFGWVEPTGALGGDAFVHSADGNILLTAKKQIKLMPSDTINQKLNEKVKKIEEVEGRPLKKKEKDNIKDEIIQDMLPQAFTRDSYANVLILTSLNMILVDVSSHTKAEEVLSLLRKTMGSLPVVPAIGASAFETLVTGWIKEGASPARFSMLDEVVLKSVTSDGGTAKLAHQDLASEEVKQHLEAGKVATKCAFDWQGRMKYLMSDAFVVSKIKWADELKDQNDDIPREEQLARFDADFALACGELRVFLVEMFDSFGGFPKEAEQKDGKADFEEMCTHIELLEEARDYVVKSNRATVTGLQRQFKIGYNQAYRIMEALEKCWIVSEPKQNGGREILVSDQKGESNEN
ncbi:recombinase [Vibrio phage vB_VpaS_1601]|uniref:exonuclease recombination-associated n=1 Tax=Vibrio phage SHOU24 TaxID=1414739 RepID=UPI0003ED22EF|nr:exonuclease recombination-associated [Vibrio phage SHOU24]AHI61211.1 recombinase [Vibrio phage SHOU24]WHM52760.1 recombinase [Vibrio phage vB_VpaP_1601]